MHAQPSTKPHRPNNKWVMTQLTFTLSMEVNRESKIEESTRHILGTSPSHPQFISTTRTRILAMSSLPISSSLNSRSKKRRNKSSFSFPRMSKREIHWISSRTLAAPRTHSLSTTLSLDCLLLKMMEVDMKCSRRNSLTIILDSRNM